MLVAETALLKAVRDKIRDELAIGPCDLQLDDQIPATAQDDYYAVIGAGTRPGPRHNTSGGVFDLVYSVRVVIYHRITHVARDRRRSVYDNLFTTMNAKLDDIIPLLDFKYDLLADAQAMLSETVWADGKYVEPFRRFTPDPNPRTVMRDPYDAAVGTAGDPIVALARGITFEGVRFLFARDL
jgi:hypothetical protein